MEKPPQFIKEFSKDASSEERDEVAQKIKAKRAEYFSAKKEKEDKIEDLEGDVANKTEETQEQLEQIENLKATLEKLNSSLLTRISEYFEIKKLKADLERGARSYEQLSKERGAMISEKEFLEAQLQQGDSSGKLEEARNMLQEFYSEQKHKWAESDYTKEDIAKYFTEEHLSSLSLEDYILLLKRFPKYMVTHVTRQGIRDHTGMAEHSAGLSEFHDGFTKILEQGKMQSALGIYISEGLKKASIKKFIKNNLDNMDSFERDKLISQAEQGMISYEQAEMARTLISKDAVLDNAKKWLKKFTSPNLEELQGDYPSGIYGDKSAIHFATEIVLDKYYGAERGNEIFFIFPSALIASQYYYQGTLEKTESGPWSDQWVWTNEHRGIDINTGIAFIPEEAMIDSITGSKYELDKDKKPIINETSNKSETPYRLAKNPISSKDFWENYFQLHPKQKPSKIVYYKGGDPTEALMKWRKENGIVKSKTNEDFGRSRDGFSSEATQGLDRFRNLAEEMINEIVEEYFANKHEEVPQ